MTRSTRRSQNRNFSRRRRRDPNIYTLEAISIATADSATTTNLVTTSEKSPTLITLRSALLEVSGGATTAQTFFVIRRVPSGYSAPAITVTSGLTTFVDQPDVLAYGFCSYITTTVDPDPVLVRMLRPTMLFYEGDVLTIQATSNTNSTGLVYNGVIEWDSRFA